MPSSRFRLGDISDGLCCGRAVDERVAEALGLPRDAADGVALENILLSPTCWCGAPVTPGSPGPLVCTETVWHDPLAVVPECQTCGRAGKNCGVVTEKDGPFVRSRWVCGNTANVVPLPTTPAIEASAEQLLDHTHASVQRGINLLLAENYEGFCQFAAALSRADLTAAFTHACARAAGDDDAEEEPSKRP